MELSVVWNYIVVSVAPMMRNSTSLAANHPSLSRGATDHLVYANFVLHEFYYLNITVMGAASIDEPGECGFACVNTLPCFSFNLAAFPDINGHFLCELLPSDKYNNSDKLVSNQMFHHYSIWSECSSGTCQNNGTCLPTYEKNTYTCACAAGFTGTNCEDVDECASSPCLSGGNCSDLVNGYNCTCQPGFIGTQCETDIDECASYPCRNGGNCTNLVNDYRCDCYPGFTGKNCENAPLEYHQYSVFSEPGRHRSYGRNSGSDYSLSQAGTAFSTVHTQRCWTPVSVITDATPI